MIWNLDEILLAFGLHCLNNWILPNCWHSDMFRTISASLRFLLWFCPSLLSVAVIFLLVYLNRHAANCHSPMNCTRKIIIIRKRSWQRNRSLSWSLPFLELLGIPNFHRPIVINYGDRTIAPILLLTNYLLTFELRGDVKETVGGYMADAKSGAFFVVRCQFLPRSLL